MSKTILKALIQVLFFIIYMIVLVIMLHYFRLKHNLSYNENDLILILGMLAYFYGFASCLLILKINKNIGN